MSTDNDFYHLQAVNYSSEQVNCLTPNDEQFVNYPPQFAEYPQHADNRAPTTMIEVLQHYSTEYHVGEEYQNEYCVESNSPDGQTIQYFDNNLNQQEHHEQYVDFNSQNLIFQQSNDLLLPDNNYFHSSDKIDVPDFSEPQGQYVDYNMSSNDFTTASQKYDLSKAIYPISKKNVQKSKAPSITVKKRLPNGFRLYSKSEIKKILSLPITLEGKIVPRNLLERILYELHVRNIHKQKFAKNVLGKSPNIFKDMSRSSEEWYKLKRARRESFEKMKEWLDMSEDEKKAAVERESNYKRSQTALTQAQREALESCFEKFPNSRKTKFVELADQLGLPWNVVRNYFFNQRSRQKHQRNHQQ